MSKNRFLRLAVIALGTFAMTGCGSSNCPDTSATSVAPTTSTDTTPAAAAATLVNGFSSPAVYHYSNMRPTYNYYLTTFEFQTLEIYSDNTYCFGISSSTFSALILPEEGNDATANERTNYLYKYYGSFTAKDDDIDTDTRYYTLAKPTRLVMFYDSTKFCDTDNWNDDAKQHCTDVVTEYNKETGEQTGQTTTTYETGAEYLAAHPGFDSIEVTATLSCHMIDFVKEGITL